MKHTAQLEGPHRGQGRFRQRKAGHRAHAFFKVLHRVLWGSQAKAKAELINSNQKEQEFGKLQGDLI